MRSEHDAFARALSLAVHELRTPVTVTAGYLRMLLREQAGPLAERQRKMLEEAERSCGRINALITELSELGKLAAGEITPPGIAFDLAALVTEVASSMHDGDDRGIHVEARAPRPVTAAGDRNRLAAVLRALVHAAVRERADAGVVIVHCSAVKGTDRSWAVVTVGDERTAAALADSAGTTAAPPPFDEWRGGLGLALPVGRRVIEAHGGAVWSAPGNPRAGSALRLPLVQEEAASS